MSHLDTAFKIGAHQATNDFEYQLQKLALGDVVPEGPAGGSSAVASGQAGGMSFGTGPSARGTPLGGANAGAGAGMAAAPGAGAPNLGGNMQLNQPSLGSNRPGPGTSGGMMGALSPGKLQMG